MRLLAWRDGDVIEASEFSLAHPYVMQRIHTLEHKAYNIARHVELLREDSMTLFGFASRCSAADAERIVEKLIKHSRVSTTLSAPVVMRLDSKGSLSFEVENPLYTSGIQLRAKRLYGIDVAMTPPNTKCQTSATVATDAILETAIHWHGGDIAIWVDAEKNVINIPWRPIFAIHNGIVYTPCELDTVEYTSVVRAINKLGMQLSIRTIPFESLLRMEEVFVADIMSVTSLSAIKNSRLLSVYTSRIVDRMEPK